MHSQTSTVQPLNSWWISDFVPHLTSMWLFIHAGIKVKLVSKRAHWYQQIFPIYFNITSPIEEYLIVTEEVIWLPLFQCQNAEECTWTNNMVHQEMIDTKSLTTMHTTPNGEYAETHISSVLFRSVSSWLSVIIIRLNTNIVYTTYTSPHRPKC